MEADHSETGEVRLETGGDLEAEEVDPGSGLQAARA